MNGLMVSLNILILAGTAIGQQATEDVASTMPNLRLRPDSSAASTVDVGNQFEGPGPDDSSGGWSTARSVLGDQSTTTSRSMSNGGQSTNFSGRSERASSTPPAAATRSQGIRFDVMLGPQDLESVRRGGTLVAPVDIRDRQNEMLSTDVVSDIAFFHEANKGKRTDGVYILPEAIEPGSRKLRFKLTSEQLDQIDDYAYQFRVPSNMRGEFDEVEFYAAEVVGDNRVGSNDFGGSWKTGNDLASDLPAPNDGGTRFGTQLRREGTDGGIQGDSNLPASNRFGDLAKNWEQKNRVGGTAPEPSDRNLGGRFGGEGFERRSDQGAAKKENMELAEMRRKLEESERLAQQALADRKRWYDESVELANEKSYLARQKQQLESKLDAASRDRGSGDSSLMRPINTKPFGSERGQFSPVDSERDRQLDLAKKQIEQLKQENQFVSSEKKLVEDQFDELKGYSKTLLGRYRNEQSRRSVDETTDLIKSTLRDSSGLAGVKSFGDRIASNTEFSPTDRSRTPVGLGSFGAQAAGGNQNVGNRNLGDTLAGNRNKATSKTNSGPGKTDFFLWLFLLPSIGLNFYLSILCRSLYVRYQDLADELREMFSATSA